MLDNGIDIKVPEWWRTEIQNPLPFLISGIHTHTQAHMIRDIKMKIVHKTFR